MNLNKYSNLFLTEVSVLSIAFLLIFGFFIYIAVERQDSYNLICGADISLIEVFTTDLGQGCN